MFADKKIPDVNPQILATPASSPEAKELGRRDGLMNMCFATADTTGILYVIIQNLRQLRNLKRRDLLYGLLGSCPLLCHHVCLSIDSRMYHGHGRALTVTGEDPG